MSTISEEHVLALCVLQGHTMVKNSGQYPDYSCARQCGCDLYHHRYTTTTHVIATIWYGYAPCFPCEPLGSGNNVEHHANFEAWEKLQRERWHDPT